MGTKEPLKPSFKGAPRYSLTPTYRLGTLIATAFFLSAVTGLIMASHYGATPEEAYVSTLRIYRRLPYGALILTTHVYSAYALVLLYLAHMMRSYFVSAYQRPREPIWMLDVLLYLVVIGLCFTGFVLPWFDSSKAFTDASIRFVKSLPSGEVLTRMIFGEGDMELIKRGYGLHIMILPLVFLGVLFLKTYLHRRLGAAEQVSIYPEEDSEEILSWFPDVASYLILISSVLVAVIIIISAVFPFALPEEFSADKAVSSYPYLQWYFLWISNLINIVDGAAARSALFSTVLLLVLALFVLPFLDRTEKTHPHHRPVHTALGILAVVEFSLLTIWGHIPHILFSESFDALVILGVPILIIAVYIIRQRHREIV